MACRLEAASTVCGASLVPSSVCVWHYDVFLAYAVWLQCQRSSWQTLPPRKLCGTPFLHQGWVRARFARHSSRQQGQPEPVLEPGSCGQQFVGNGRSGNVARSRCEEVARRL